ncbi:MAG: AAA family ATPase [Gemmatimonadota bacterium]
MTKILLVCLGRPALYHADGSSVAIAGKAVALLAYMRLNAQRSAHRAFLADLLWSEADDEKGRASLRGAISALREVLGADVLVGDAGELRLVRDVPCDVADFVSAAASGDNLAAVSAYRGDFFADFALPGATGFELWATIERQRLRSIFVRCADSVVQQLLDTGRARAALDIAVRLVDADDARQRSWRLLLECRLGVQEFAAALLDAARLEAVMLGHDMPLEAATRALLRRVEQQQAIAPQPGAPVMQADLVGRTAAFSSLLDRWKEVGVGHQAVIAIGGEAGLGKSRLLDDLATRLRSHGARVLLVRARHGDRGIPFALLQQLVSALVALPGAAGVAPESARTLVGLEPRLGSTFVSADAETVSGVDVPLRRATALADLIGAVSDDRPVALLIDDLHWADGSSVTALASALARTTAARVLVVVAQRNPVTSAFRQQVISLEALDEADLQQLLGSMLVAVGAGVTTPFAARLLASTRGVPLLVMEALQLLVQESLLVPSDGAWTVTDVPALLTRLQALDVMAERLAPLDAVMRDLLLQLALAAVGVRGALLRAGRPPGDGVHDAVARLQLGGWISESEGVVSVSHDEISRAVVEAATPEELRAARAALVAALDGLPAPDTSEARLLARVLVDVDDVPALYRHLARWSAAATSSRRGGGWREAGAELLGATFNPSLTQQLTRYEPWTERVAPVARRTALVVGSAAVVLILGLLVRARERAPAAIRFVTPPLATTSVGITPAVEVEILNGAGGRITASGDTVHLSLTSPNARLEGNLAVVAESGLARFPSARVTGELDSLNFLQARSGALRTGAVRLLGTHDAAVHVVKARIADPRSGVTRGDTLVLNAGVRTVVQLDLRYTAPWMSAAVMLAGVPTWGDRASSWIELGPCATPARNAVRFTMVPITAPTQPGHYRLFLVLAAESDAAHIASGTNWAFGAPQWGDGNDVADWGDSEVSRAQRTGHVRIAGRWLYRGGRRGWADLGAAVVEVIVQAPPRVAAQAR